MGAFYEPERNEDTRAMVMKLCGGDRFLLDNLPFSGYDTIANPETDSFFEKTGCPCIKKPFLIEELKDAIQSTLKVVANA